MHTDNGYLFILHDVLAVYGELIKTIEAQPQYGTFYRALNATGVGVRGFETGSGRGEGL